MKLENKNYRMELTGGYITDFRFLHSPNIADPSGDFGSACYTLLSDDIKTMPHEPFEAYHTKRSSYHRVEKLSHDRTLCTDENNRIDTLYTLSEDGLIIRTETKNNEISEFGLNINLNFSGKKGSDYQQQFLPTTPYTSQDGQYQYFLLTRPGGGFVTITARTKCDGWKLKYSPYSFGHFLLNLQFLASFDRVYHGSGNKKLEVCFSYAATLQEAFHHISKEYHMPLLGNVLSGGFDGRAYLKLYGRADTVRLQYPGGKIAFFRPDSHNLVEITTEEFGLHTVTPILDGKDGLNTTVWNGKNIQSLFDKSADAVKEPYHPDENLCEGGCFLWELLLNMRLKGHWKYDAIARKELDTILCRTLPPVPRRTIATFAQNGFAPYHIFRSNRVQEQFFGASILLEAYRLYGERDILEYAIHTLNELVEHYMINGKVDNGEDYTTVCCPMIPLVDMALFLKNSGDNRYITFENAASEMAEYLYKRGFDFPTEGSPCDLSGKEYEDGSISCTALGLLYYCYHVQKVKKYLDFARQVLTLHEAWTMYTPDARIYGSGFRWWETIWEGDGDGPALCAGHAWTIWKAEALYYLGILQRDDEAMLASWNGFVTNFSKTMADGSMYSCYIPDFICGGGSPEIRRKLKQLAGEQTGNPYRITHGYPAHKDNSLSRYAWIRAAETWLTTGAVLKIDGQIIAVNAQIRENLCTFDDSVTRIYISDAAEGLLPGREIAVV